MPFITLSQNIENVRVVRKMFYSVSDTGDSENKNPSSSNRSRTYDFLVTSPDALPLSYRRLVGAKVIKL